jgi:hypothetical protein
MILKVAIPKLH